MIRGDLLFSLLGVCMMAAAGCSFNDSAQDLRDLLRDRATVVDSGTETGQSDSTDSVALNGWDTWVFGTDTGKDTGTEPVTVVDTQWTDGTDTQMVVDTSTSTESLCLVDVACGVTCLPCVNGKHCTPKGACVECFDDTHCAGTCDLATYTCR